MAIHDLDLARFLVDEVEEVHAWAAVLFDDRFAEADDFDTAVTMLRFRNGALGVVETARHSAWGYDIRTEVAGATGKVVVDGGQKTPVAHMRQFAVEVDLYENFSDRFEVAYRRQFEAFFADLAAGSNAIAGAGRRHRDAAPGRCGNAQLARESAGARGRSHGLSAVHANAPRARTRGDQSDARTGTQAVAKGLTRHGGWASVGNRLRDVIDFPMGSIPPLRWPGIGRRRGSGKPSSRRRAKPW